MFPAAATPTAPMIAPLGRPPDQPSAYCPIPQRLITDLHDNPLAIGLYALITRLYLVVQSPIPLSVPDVVRYDPTLSRGAVLRALARLLAGGYLIGAEQTGRKTRYTPAWGRIGGTALAWNMGQPCLGRPRHIARLRLDRRLLDICMGKLVPHMTRAAVITRYVTTPVLSLSDVGCYALTLADVPRTTPALIRLGAVQNGMARLLPSDERLLALLSQRALDLGEEEHRGTALTLSGTRKLGITPLLAPDPQTAMSQPLFFVPPELIGSLIDPMIGSMIGSEAAQYCAATAAGRDESQPGERAERITWELRDPSDIAISPPSPPHDKPGGGGADVLQQAGPRKQRQETHILPDTEAAAALQAINVKPTQIAELAHLPLATVEIAIADGRARPGVRDLAGWVVSLLRAHRDYGWRITPPRSAPDAPEALRDAFARYAAEQEDEQCAFQVDVERSVDESPAPKPAASSINIRKLWNIVLTTMQAQLPGSEFNTWIRICMLLSINDDIATIRVPNTLVKEGLERRYGATLRDLFSMLIGFPIQLRIVVGEQDAVAGPTDAQQVLPTSGRDPSQVATRLRAPAQSTSQSEVAHRPDWITAECWAVLPAMLRAALLGSTLVDGTVQTISPHLDLLIAARYAYEVTALIEAALPLVSSGRVAPKP
jgi:hypothetical protein